MVSCIFERYKVHLSNLLEVKPFDGNGVGVLREACFWVVAILFVVLVFVWFFLVQGSEAVSTELH